MPNTREKLIELLCNSLCFGYDDVTDTEYVLWSETADRLIANGVTIQEWIPVSERLPEKDDKVLAVVKEDGYNRIAFVFYEDRRWWDCFYDGFHNINVTHWMPLPEPPKGE